MASVYTTKRGKTKKAKLGIRKDANNNAANKFTQKMKTDSTTTKSAEIPAWQLRQQEIALKLKGSEDQSAKLALTSKCSSPICKVKASTAVKLSLCGNCKTVAYCSRDCQTGHWPEHKELCRKIVAERDDSTRSILETLINLESQVKDNIKTLDANDPEHKKRLEQLGLSKKPIELADENKNTTTTTATTTTTTTTTSQVSQTDEELSSHVNKSLFINDDIEDLPSDEDDN